MSEDGHDHGDAAPSGGDDAGGGFAATRRRLLLGAAAASTVVTIRPALAETAGSVMNCQIPVPDPRFGAGKWIDKRGKVVDYGTRDAFRPPSRPLTAEQIKAAMKGASFPGASREASQAYMAYITGLKNGMSGFTCYQSIQMPRT